MSPTNPAYNVYVLLGMRFATYDNDHSGCASSKHGAWWYNYCSRVHLNAFYIKNGATCPYQRCIVWVDWPWGVNELKTTEMKIKPY